MSVIGALMTNPALFPELGDLSPDHFYLPVNQILFTTLRTMYLADEKIDSITLFGKLKENQDLRRVGSAPYLADCLQAYKNDQNVDAYAKLVKDQWVIRRIHDFGHKCINIADTAEEVPQAVESVYQFLDSLEQKETTDSELMPVLLDRWDDWRTAESEPAIPTPWPDMNEVLGGGSSRGRLYIPVGRPGHGKSLAGLNVCLKAAQQGHSSLIFSLEMSKSECTTRIVSAGANVRAKNIFGRSLSVDDEEKIATFRSMWGGMNLTINDNPNHTIETIAAEARAHKQKYGLDVLFIDYLGLISASNGKLPRREQLGHITKQAKLLSRKLDCAVWMAAQAGRGSETEDRNPRLADIKDSADIEADADAVLFIVRGENEKIGQVDVHVLKNRSGITGRVIELQDRYHVMRLDG